MRVTHAWLQRYGRALWDRAPGLVREHHRPVLLVAVLMGLGLLVLGVSWRSLRARPHTTVAQESPVAVAVPINSPSNAAGGKPYLGIRGKTFRQGEVQGVQVLEVFPGSPAARAGLRSDGHPVPGTGHIIVGIDGQPIRSEEDLAQLLARSSPGTQLQLFLTRTVDHTSEVIAVTLGAAPAVPPGAQSTAETEPGLAWPESPRKSPQVAGPGGNPPAHSAARIPPVGWSGHLIPILLQMGGGNAATLPPADMPPDVIDAYLEQLEIAPVPRTRLVKIAFHTRDPELAARVANTHAIAYLRQGIQLRSRASEEALQFLDEKLAELKERVEKSEAVLNRYRRDRGIISLDSRENIVVDRLADLNKRLTEAEAERIALEAQTRLIRKNEYDALPAVIDNRLIQSLKGELARLEGEYAELGSKFKPGYPGLDQLHAKVEQTKRRLQQETQRTVGGIRSAYAAAKQKEDELRARMEQQKVAALSLKDASVEYAILAREVDMNRQLYESVLQRLKEMQVAAALRASNVSVIDHAVPPLKPARPNKKLSLLLSTVVGLVGGVGLAFFVEHLSNTLKTPQEVQRYLRLPNLGMVPDFVRSARRSHDPFSAVTESYRMLRTAILLAQVETSPKTLLFTSGVHGEGKTVTVVNTAAVLAQTGVSVLVIDADLRCAAGHTVLGMENDVGLVEVLTGQRSVVEAIRPTATEHLFFLSSGSLPPNPTELVGSRRMRDTLALLQAQFDYILIDSPPVMPASDAVLLSTMVDAVVLVANAQQTPRQVVREACARLSYARAKILGVVLNRLPLRYREYAYYYRPYQPAA